MNLDGAGLSQWHNKVTTTTKKKTNSKSKRTKQTNENKQKETKQPRWKSRALTAAVDPAEKHHNKLPEAKPKSPKLYDSK